MGRLMRSQSSLAGFRRSEEARLLSISLNLIGGRAKYGADFHLLADNLHRYLHDSSVLILPSN
jgi:hypothetical protein